jgi:hypothetical protein
MQHADAVITSSNELSGPLLTVNLTGAETGQDGLRGGIRSDKAQTAQERRARAGHSVPPGHSQPAIAGQRIVGRE